MALFAFKRLREQKAAAEAAVSAPAKTEPKTTARKANGSNNRRNSGRGKLEQLHDAGGS